eukprot:764449-Hanusia_phi.AAC.6
MDVINGVYTQASPTVIVGINGERWEYVRTLDGAAAVLAISVWESSLISQSSNQPGNINVITISLTPAVPIKAGSSLTVIGLTGTAAIPSDVYYIPADCDPSPCLLISPKWDRSAGQLQVQFVQDIALAQAISCLSMTLQTEMSH